MKKEKPRIEDYYQGNYNLVDLRTKWSNKQSSAHSPKSSIFVDFGDKEVWTILLGIGYTSLYYYLYSFGMVFFLIVPAAFVLAIYTVSLVGFVFSSLGPLETTRRTEEEKLDEEDKVLLEEIKSLERYEKDLSQWNIYNSETGYEYWNKLKGVALEFAVSDLLERFGWSTELTKKSGDGGIDLVIRKDEREILVQCKGHALNIGVGPIRDAAGVKALHKKDFIVVGPSGFSKGAREFAEQSEIELWDTQKLIHVAKNGY